MANQITIFLLSLGALQGLLLSWYLLRNRRAHLANIYFILILIIAGLQLIFKVLSKGWLIEHSRLPYFISYLFPYLIGPLLFLYVKARANLTFRKTHLLHFTPFLMASSFTILQFFNRYEFRLFGISMYTQAALQLMSLSVYAVMAWRVIQQEKELNPLKSFLIGLVCGESIIIITLAVMYVYYGRFPEVRLLFIVLTLFIYWMCYKQLQQPHLFTIPVEQPILQLHLKVHTKYNHSSLKAEEAARITDLLTHTMHHQKLFLDSDLSIDSLSRQLNVSRHHISQVLNENFQLTYSDFISDLRLTEAKDRLQQKKFQHYTIAAIAMDSGFSSVSNFNELFKKKFNQTPSQCRSEGLGKMTA